MENSSSLSIFGYPSMPEDYTKFVSTAIYDMGKNKLPCFKQVPHSERGSSVETLTSLTSGNISPPLTVTGTACNYKGLESLNRGNLQGYSQQGTETLEDCEVLNTYGKRLSSAPTDGLLATKKRKTVTGTYKRYPDKPPYRYVGLIITAIQNSAEKQLTLAGVHEWLKQHFEFFRGDYIGWKDSVRHNLSSNKCFYKEVRQAVGEKNKRKLNFWTVDLSKITADVFRRQENKLGKSGLFAPFIHEELRLPPVDISRRNNETDKSKDARNTVELDTTTVNDIVKTPTLKRDHVNVELPKKVRTWYKVVSESPENLRQSSSVEQSRDTPKSSTNSSCQTSKNITSLKTSCVTDQEMPYITPAIRHLQEYFAHTEQNNHTHWSVQNLSLLCTSISQDCVNPHQSCQNRQEDKCLENSTGGESNLLFHQTKSSITIPGISTEYTSSPTVTPTSTACINFSYPVFHQASTCSSQRVLARYSSASSHLYDYQPPSFQHSSPVVCHFPFVPTPHYYSPLHHTAAMPPKSFSNANGNYISEFPSMPLRKEESQSLDKSIATVKKDKERRSCMHAYTGDKLNSSDSGPSAFTEVKKES